MKYDKKINLTIVLLLFAVWNLSAQERKILLTLNGVVIDAKTKAPLAGASVDLLVDSVKYAWRSTREGGQFDFRGAHLSEGVMRVRKEGYRTKEFPVNRKNNGPYRIKLKRLKK